MQAEMAAMRLAHATAAPPRNILLRFPVRAPMSLIVSLVALGIRKVDAVETALRGGTHRRGERSAGIGNTGPISALPQNQT